MLGVSFFVVFFSCSLSSFKQRIYWLALPSQIIENLTENPGVFFFFSFSVGRAILGEGESILGTKQVGSFEGKGKCLSQADASQKPGFPAQYKATCSPRSRTWWWHFTKGHFPSPSQEHRAFGTSSSTTFTHAHTT